MLGQQIDRLPFGETKSFDSVEQFGVDDRRRWQFQRDLLRKRHQELQVRHAAPFLSQQLDPDVGTVDFDGRIGGCRA